MKKASLCFVLGVLFFVSRAAFCQTEIELKNKYNNAADIIGISSLGTSNQALLNPLLGKWYIICFVGLEFPELEFPEYEYSLNTITEDTEGPGYYYVIGTDESWDMVLASYDHNLDKYTLFDPANPFDRMYVFDAFNIVADGTYYKTSTDDILGTYSFFGLNLPPLDTPDTTTIPTDTSTTTTIPSETTTITTTIPSETTTTTSIPSGDTTTTTIPSGDTTTTTTMSDDNTGELGGPCYPNGTCNSGLTCVDNICVEELKCTISFVLGDDDPRLDTIRRFRDEVLANSAVGKKLIEMYYKNDERIMEILENHSSTKEIAKNILEALIPSMGLLLKKIIKVRA